MCVGKEDKEEGDAKAEEGGKNQCSYWHTD